MVNFMRILLDGNPLENITAVSVKEATDVAANVTRDRGRMIVEVIVDGEKLNEKQIQDELAGSSPADEVQFNSADSRKLVSSAFQDSIDALAEADNFQREAAELIQADRSSEAMEKLNQAIQIWQSVQKAVMIGVEIVTVDPGDEKHFEELITGAIERLNQQLSTIKEGLNSDDPIGISDALMYDMPEVVQEWRSLLHELSGRVAGEVKDNDQRIEISEN